MTQAPLPPLETKDLNFDVRSRLQHLGDLLQELKLSPSARILDVGGHPCHLARIFSDLDITTVDIFDTGHSPYLKASGTALPFADKAFHVVIACDVLEHIPPDQREVFLQELIRVASSAIVVAGPYCTPGTQRAESIIQKLLPDSSDAQRWLKEHAEYGLPSVGETMAVFSGCAHGIRVIPTDTISAWLLFFAAQTAEEHNHTLAKDMRNFALIHNELTSALKLSAIGPAYRHAVVAALTDDVWQHLSPTTADIADHAHEWIRVEDYVGSLGRLFEAMLRPGPCDPNNAPGVDQEYVARLEQMLANRNMEPREKAGSMKERLKHAWRVIRNG